MNNVELLHKYCERFYEELEDEYLKIEKTPMQPCDLEIIKMLFSSLQKAETIIAMKENGYPENEYSGKSIRIPNVNYGYSGNMQQDYSGQRRDSMGRYSGHSENSEILDRLEEKLRMAKSEDEAKSIRDAINAVSRIR